MNDSSKLEALKELIEDHNNEKVVIFCKYSWEIDRIQEELSKYKKHLLFEV